ncbi:MgtC/SapB family protein [Pantoea dispersa]|uniref:MgtC/SapB family protein n=1 Tax=Pantoea dispersa TaxID=59814 RepID=UPI0039BE6E2F
MLADMLIRIALAGILGGLIGLERQMRAKEAGLRTHILVGIGSAMFMLVSKYGFADMLTNDHVALDPSRIAAQVVLETFRRISHWLIGRHHTLIVHLKAKSVPLVLLVLQRENLRYGHIAVVNRNEESGLCELSVEVTLSRRFPMHSIYDKVMEIKGVQSLEMV